MKVARKNTKLSVRKKKAVGDTGESKQWFLVDRINDL